MFRYRAFISYSRSDLRYAAQLQRDLEGFRIPRAIVDRLGVPGNRVRPIFRDASDLPAATGLGSALSEALENSDSLIVICSPGACASQWVNKEIQEFRRLRGEEAKILTVIAPTAGNTLAEKMFPAALGTSSPLAADSRKSEDGRRMAVLKIVAGLFEIGLDDLIRRDSRRRHNTLVAGITGATMVAVTMGILAAFALSARQDAQRRLTQSEDLITFMLGDLRDQLTPIGRVGVLKSVGDRALAYFESLDDSDLTDVALLRKSRNLYQVGDVYFKIRDYESALKSFRLSLDQTRLLTEAEPDDNERLYEFAQAEFYAGSAAYNFGDVASAEQHFNSYHTAAWVLHERQPDNLDWILETFYASDNLGSVALAQNKFDTARSHFEDAIVLINSLIDIDATQDRLHERAGTLSWLASSHSRLGALNTSQSTFLEAVNTPLDADNAVYQEDRAYQLGKLAVVETHLGQLARARSYAEEAVRIARALSEADPDSVDFVQVRLVNEQILAGIGNFEGLPVDYSALQAGTRRELEAPDPLPVWYLLALDVADIGVRIGDTEALDWATELLGTSIAVAPDDRETERAYINLAVSTAKRNQMRTDRLRLIIEAAAARYSETQDFDLVLPLFRGYDFLGDEENRERMHAVLAGAGSEHPDSLR
jgi:tetratricopeptide (TPR) repeat protein